MSTRLEIINNALVTTGNEALNVEYDGSPEWQVADVAYRRAVASGIARFRWPWAKTSETLVATGDDPPSPRWEFAYARPATALHVVGIYLEDAPLTRFEQVDTTICMDVDASAYDAGALKCLFVREPPEGQFPAGFREYVTMVVEAHLYRGLNEDPAEARARERDAEGYLTELRTLTTQESGKRAAFRSRTAIRRRVGGPVYRGFP